MAPLPGELRASIERTIVQARDAAEEAARSALAALQVEAERLPAAFPHAQRRLRNALRARARQLGQGQLKAGWQPLVEEVAYEQWHRMLFARFLAENNLLMHPSGAAVTLEECAELAPDEDEPNAWALAARYASQMLPGIFRQEDPSAQLRLTPEGQRDLESMLQELPRALITADDGLGWVYQFWQAKKKDEVNHAGQPIGGADLFPVTQLFTEDYMVRFLLENTLGARWAARYPDSPLVNEWPFLRFRNDGTPAAGIFPGWPERVAEVTVLDPCCGSGHFLVAAFEMLRRMRMEEEGLGDAEAGDAVLRDNIFGLEIDPRCVQIAAFAVAIAAWKAGGYRELPIPRIACSGIPVEGQLDDWVELAGNDANLAIALRRLYQLFRNAPDLGSLIDPTEVPAPEWMFAPDYARVEPILNLALGASQSDDDPASALFGAAAQGAVKAAALLAAKYTLVSTNVPYLGRDRQTGVLRDFSTETFELGKADLATTFVQRCLRFCTKGGAVAVVSPQNWLFLVSYKPLREQLLREKTWDLLAILGEHGFASAQAAGAFTSLLILTQLAASDDHTIQGIDVSAPQVPSGKAAALKNAPPVLVPQRQQLSNPGVRILLSALTSGDALGLYASVNEGLHTGDYPRFGRKFWELPFVKGGWALQQGGPDRTAYYAGREHILFWEDGDGELLRYVQLRLNSQNVSMWIKGSNAWGRTGVAVSTMRDLKSTLYTGEVFTHGVVVIIPREIEHISALWKYCTSEEFRANVRKLDRKIAVARATFEAVPFDVERWAEEARKSVDLPDPGSTSPNQWVFDGKVEKASEPLQVAVALLLGYRWPQQREGRADAQRDSADMVCLPALVNEPPASERLRELLAVIYDEEWTNALQQELLAAVATPGKDLSTWLRDDFFRQHCSLFHNRPFVWHIWDGRKDGFSALVPYHRFDAALMDKLIYTYLGTWITDQRAQLEADVAGAEGRLIAATVLQRKLEGIRLGEPPFDIYVRWKPLHQQPIGWNPDLNDGVRLNIRPFVEAGILRSRFTINWKKDRGNNPDGSERHNDPHFTVAEKLAARRQAGLEA
jgi:hypothetical protein